MKPKHRRSILLLLSVVFLSMMLVIVASNLKDNISFFYYPTQLLSTTINSDKIIRLGGVVVPGSIIKHYSHIEFCVTDNKNIISVSYTKKVLPNLFNENNGIVAEGSFINGKFIATSILAKHNEVYRP